MPSAVCDPNLIFSPGAWLRDLQDQMIKHTETFYMTAALLGIRARRHTAL